MPGGRGADRRPQLRQPLSLAVRGISAFQVAGRDQEVLSKAASACATGRARSPRGASTACPKTDFPGGLLIGCDAGTLNFAKIKGAHTAMKSGCWPPKLCTRRCRRATRGAATSSPTPRFRQSWLYAELHQARNFGPALHKFGTFLGGAFNWIQQNPVAVAACSSRSRIGPAITCSSQPAARCQPIEYARPDGELTFDRLSSVFISNTAHEEEQPVHLQLLDSSKAIAINFKEYASPEQRYCPAGVYEIVAEASGRGCRSTPRTACTARPATSRIRPRTSAGCRPRAAADRTIPTCDATVRPSNGRAPHRRRVQSSIVAADRASGVLRERPVDMLAHQRRGVVAARGQGSDNRR
jgi:hypothetical protein